MAEEDDGRIRVLQSLRGKICKCDLYVYCSPHTHPLVLVSGRGGGGEGGGQEAEPSGKGCRRGAAECGGRGGHSSLFCPGADLACYRRLNGFAGLLSAKKIWRHMSNRVDPLSFVCLFIVLFICLIFKYTYFWRLTNAGAHRRLVLEAAEARWKLTPPLVPCTSASRHQPADVPLRRHSTPQ